MTTEILCPGTEALAWRPPVEPHHAPLFAFALLTAACALASFAFACATPFAAFAVIATALIPPLPSALAVVSAAWIVNQAIGFGVLHYPVDAGTMAWGFVIGLAAFAATLIASVTLRALRLVATAITLSAALLGAYAAYELVLFTATPFLGGDGNLTLAMVSHLGVLNILWLIGLVAACEVFRFLNPGRNHQTAS
jgi:hypothetical protein